MTNKTLKLSLNHLLIFAFTLLLASCNKMELNPLIDPETQPSELSRALIIEGNNNNGNTPESSIGFGVPQITHFQNSASAANDNTLFIPLAFAAEADIKKIYFQVSGADNYWQLPVLIDAAQKSHVFKVGIPGRVLNGQFEVGVVIEDAQGAISQPAFLSVRIEDSEKVCIDGESPGRIEGTDGITIKTLYFGDHPGIISISYEMYNKPDRMDIFYNKEWVAGTGNEIRSGATPPSSQCYDGAEGYVPGQGTLSFQYDPSKGKRVDVYLSGCYGGTEWYFDVQCPEDWFGELPDCPCNYDATIDGTQIMGGTWINCGDASQAFHFGAHHEIRWYLDDEHPGQQCTYNQAGELITAGIAAGSPDRISPASCGSYDWVNEIGVAMFCGWSQHCILDVRPWESTPCTDYLKLWPANQGSGCGSGKTVSGINHMLKLVGRMDCEKITVLLKAATDSQEINGQLKAYLLGNSPNNLNESAILNALKAWKTAACDSFWNPDFCTVLDEAIGNMGG